MTSARKGCHQYYNFKGVDRNVQKNLYISNSIVYPVNTGHELITHVQITQVNPCKYEENI